MSEEMDEGLLAHQNLMTSGVSHDKRSMEIGWYGRIVKSRNEFARHGCADETAYRQMVRVGRTTWYRMIRIAGALSQLKREEFLALSADNADHLSRLNDEERYDPELLDAARTMTEPDFQRKLMEYRAAAENKPIEDIRVFMKISMFEGQKAVIAPGLQEFMKKYALNDIGTALEWMVVEENGRDTTTGFLQKNIPLLRRVLKAETLEEVRLLMGGYVVELANHLELVRGEQR